MKTQEIILNLTDYQKEILLAVLDEQANTFDNHQGKKDQRATALDVIATQIETQKPIDKFVEFAGQYLCGDAENDIETMLKLIIGCSFKDSLIDSIEGVEVTHKHEYRFTANEFLNEIGYL